MSAGLWMQALPRTIGTTANFLVQTGALPKAFDTKSVTDTSFNHACHRPDF